MNVPADGETMGEAVIAGPAVFDGYLGLGLDEANEEAFDDGWVTFLAFRQPQNPGNPDIQTNLTHFMKLTSFFLY